MPNLNHLIKERWSPRAFGEQTISDQDLETLSEAASWAASSMNEQPWKYIIAKRGSEAFNKMVTALMQGNQSWAKNASHLVISLAKKHFDRNGKVNRHAMHDVGAANTTMLLQAKELDIYGHMMGGFVSSKAEELFDVDADKWEIACFIALGYKGEATQLDEPLRARELAERTRKPTSVFTQHLD